MGRTATGPKNILTTKQETPYKTAHARRRRAAISEGTWQPFTDPTIARQRARNLHQAGYGVPALAVAFNLSPSAVESLLQRGTRRISTNTHRAVMAGRLDPRRLPPTALVSTAGSRRRLQALASMGWSYADISLAAGNMTPASIRSLMARERCNAGLAAEIALAYDMLWRLPGPHAGVSTRAKQRSLPGPLHWDDDTIDDPTARKSGQTRWAP